MPETVIRLRAPSHCIVGGPPRFIKDVYDDGYGRIWYCRPSNQCTRWTATAPIPDNWEETPRHQGELIPAKCTVTIDATPEQLAGVALLPAPRPPAPRPPRAPRVARAPRPRRPARPPRAPRAARRARAPRARRPEKPAERQNYCVFYDVFRTGTVDTTNVLQLTFAELAKVKSDPAFRAAIPIPEGASCPTTGNERCAQQAAAFVRPLQQLLGWKRPERPAPSGGFIPPTGRFIPRPRAAVPEAPPPTTLVPAPGCGDLLRAARYAEARAACPADARFFVTWETVTPPSRTSNQGVTFDELMGFIAMIQATPTSSIVKIGLYPSEL